MTDYDDFVAWHCWTDQHGQVHEDFVLSFGPSGPWRAFEIASEEAADLARRDREEGFGITRNFVQFLPKGVRPTQF